MSEDKKILALLSKIIIDKKEFNIICESDMVISIESAGSEQNSKGTFACYLVKTDNNNAFTVKVKNS